MKIKDNNHGNKFSLATKLPGEFYKAFSEAKRK